VQIDVVRSGGIAGVKMTGRIDTARLDESSRVEVERAVGDLDFAKGASPDEPRHPDGFAYTLTIVDDPAHRTARFDEAELPAVLRAQIGSVVRLG
jgi:hypothetical protein